MWLQGGSAFILDLAMKMTVQECKKSSEHCDDPEVAKDISASL